MAAKDVAKRGARAVKGQATGATYIMVGALVLGIIGRWANKQKLPSPAGLVEIVFALILITALDRGKTAGIARGFAWLFLVAVLLGKYSPITALSTVVNEQNKPAAPKPAPKKGA